MEYIKFTGKFRDLKPLGYKFQKLFARNYRSYHKECDGSIIWIWQHLGGYVEIDDFYSDSVFLIKAILNGDLNKYRHSDECDILNLFFDRKEKKIISYEDHLPERMKLYNSEVCPKEYYERYRNANFSLDFAREIIKLNEAGMIKIEERS